MEEKPTVRLQPEVVPETPVDPVPTTPPSPVSSLPNPEPVVQAPVIEPKQDSWGKFPPQVDRGPSNKPSKKLMWLVIILIAVAVAIVGLTIRQFMSKGDEVRTVVSEENTPTPTEEPTPTPSPMPEILEKSEVKIQILNASGITGRAGKAAKALEAIDFENIDTGNADVSDQVETVVEYSPKIDQKIVDEVLAEMKEMFTNVRTIANSSLTDDYHIVISTGTDEATE
jgi:hypothetical protein